jgi:hypothetical protein
MRKRLLVLLGLLSLFLPVLTAAPATANTYPGLHIQDWTHNDLVLRGRIAIEVNDAGQGRLRFHMQCFKYDDIGGLNPTLCNLYPEQSHWYDLTSGAHYSKDQSPCFQCFEDVWVGTYRTLQDNHTYAVKQANFWAYFFSGLYTSSLHTICSYRVTWHTGGSPTIGSLYCYVP